MRKLLALLIVLIAASCPAESGPKNSEPPKDLVLKPGIYPTKWTTQVRCEDAGRGRGAATKTKPPYIKSKPKFVSRAPRFGKLIMFIQLPPTSEKAESSWVFALDESKGTGTGYDTLYLDLGGHGDLANARKTAGKLDRQRPGLDSFNSFVNVAELPYNKLFPTSKNSKTVALDIVYHKIDQAVFAFVRGGYVGEIDSDKGKIPFWLLGDNWKGRYDGRAKSAYYPPDLCDGVYFDLTHTGFGAEEIEPEDGCRRDTLTAVNQIECKLYVLKPSHDGTSLEVANYTGPTVKLAMKSYSIGAMSVTRWRGSAVGTTEGFGFDLRKNGPPVELPAGDYKLSGVLFLDNSDSYSISFDIEKEHLSEAGKTVEIAVGGALTLAIGPSQLTTITQGPEAETPYLGLINSRGENVELQMESRENKLDSVKIPTAVLKNAAGEIVDKAELAEFDGELDFPRVMSQTKQLPPGKYTVEAVMDVGPLGGVLHAQKSFIILRGH